MKTISQQYDLLSADERFRLAFAADDRGDDAELTRLTASGPRVHMTAPAHFDQTLALLRLSNLAFMDLVEHASLFQDAFEIACKASDSGDQDELPEHWEHMLTFGCLLRTKYFGWIRFCKRVGVPPFGLLRKYPGFRRLQFTIKLSKGKAYTPLGYMRLMNRKRPEGFEPMTKPPLTAKGIARELFGIYRKDQHS